MKKYILEFAGSFGYLLLGSIVQLSIFQFFPFSSLILKMVLVSLGYALFYGIIYILCNRNHHVEINPIFSFSLWLKNQMGTKQFILTVLSQILSGILCGIILFTIFPSQISDLALGYGEFSMFHSTLDSIIWIEALFSFIFVFIFFMLNEKSKNEMLCGVILGILFFFLLFFSIPYTCGSVNPIRAFISNPFVNSDYLRQLWIYVLSPLAGALFSTIIYHVYSQISNNVSQ